MPRLSMILVIIAILSVNPATPFFAAIANIVTIVRLGDDLADVADGELPVSALIFGVEEYKIDRIYEKLGELTEKIEEMSDTLNNKLDVVLESILTRLPVMEKLDRRMRELQSCVRRVDSLYKTFEFYVHKENKFSNYTVGKFAEVVISFDAGGVPDVLSRMHGLIVPSRTVSLDDSLMGLVSKDINLMEVKDRLKTGMPQSRIFQIYSAIVLTEIRGYAMTAFSYAFVGALRNANFSEEIHVATAEMILRANEYILATKAIMRNVPTDFQRFDPPQHIIDETYVAFNSFQAFLVAETDIASGRSCRGECHQIITDAMYSCYAPDSWCPKRPCLGLIYNCASSGTTWACTMPGGATERYQYIRGADGLLGRYGNGCRGHQALAAPWTSGFVSCDICFCDCSEEDADSKAVRYISLRPKESYIDFNMVISGIRIIRKGLMICLQIKVGTLQADGSVKKGTESWIAQDDLQFDNSHPAGGVTEYDRYSDETVFKHSTDYALLRKAMRTMNLDDLTLPPGYVVTGVRWNHEKPSDAYWNDSPIQLEIRGTRFHIENGTLMTAPNASIWITPQNMTNPSRRYSVDRDEVDLEDPDNPTMSMTSELDSKPNQFIEFRPSDRYRDAGQHTVPFFDSQPVELSLALTGLGMYHKGGKNSGGFIGLRIFTVDLSQYMHPTQTDKTVTRYQKYMPDLNNTDIL